MSDTAPLSEAVKTGKRKDAAELTQQYLDQGVAPDAILAAMVEGMDEIGAKFAANEAFVPEMLIAARAMKESMAILEPKLVEAGHNPVATAIIGTVQGDLHDIGKNLVAMMWKGANLEVVDLGTNVPPDKFVEAAKENNAQIVGLSGLLTTTMPAMRKTVETLKSAGLDGVKVVVGGAPITQNFADEIGADGFSPDAAAAVTKVRELVAG